MKKIYIVIMLAIIGLITNAQTAYITNSSSNTVSVINVATNTVTATIPVGTNPYGVSVSADGSKVYITNNDNPGSVSVINTATNTVTASIPVGNSPCGVSVSPDGSKVYVTNYNDNTVNVINTATNTVMATIVVGNNPIGISVSPDGSKIYVSNYSDATLMVINSATNNVTATIPVGAGAGIISIHKELYINNYIANTVSVINTTTNTVTATIPVDSEPCTLSVSPDGSKVYVTIRSNNTVNVINTVTNTVSTTITVGSSPWGVSFSPDGSKAYITNYGANSVSVINTATNMVTTTIMVGASPTGSGNYISTYKQHPYSYTSGNANICKGNDTTICVYASGGTPPYQYLWSNSVTSSCQTVSPLNTTSYSATITDANGYTATSSLIITVDTASKPVITPSGSILFSTAGASYQWNLNGNPIIGATGQFYAPLSPGNYSVTVTYSNACSATSAAIIVTGINELSNSFYVSVYPNPTTDNLTIEIQQAAVGSKQNAVIEITNIQGQLIKTLPPCGEAGATTSNKTNIDVSALPSGVYIVEVKTEKGVEVKKFIKE
ncbi:MAG: T9SS type A sorting domain-containing protein [Bacteroidales bacterium]|jgi:YVTN family beta-propeller protein